MPIIVPSRNQWLKLTQQVLPTTNLKVQKQIDKKKHSEQPVLGKLFEKAKAHAKVKARAKSKSSRPKKQFVERLEAKTDRVPRKEENGGLSDDPIDIDDPMEGSRGRQGPNPASHTPNAPPTKAVFGFSKPASQTLRDPTEKE